MERERRCNVIRVPHGAGRFGSVLVWPGLVGLFCLFKVDIRAVDARVGSQRKRKRSISRRKKEGCNSHFISFRFHSIRFVFVFSPFLFSISAPKNLASLGLLSPFSSFPKACLSIYLFREVRFFFLILILILLRSACRMRVRMHSSANRLHKHDTTCPVQLI
jgi:hypothetical protein